MVVVTSGASTKAAIAGAEAEAVLGIKAAARVISAKVATVFAGTKAVIDAAV